GAARSDPPQRHREISPCSAMEPSDAILRISPSACKRTKAEGVGTRARHSFRKVGRLTPSLFLNPFENIVVANGAVRKEAVHRILLLYKNFEFSVQLSEDHQAHMKWETKQFQPPAGPHNPCVTED